MSTLAQRAATAAHRKRAKAKGLVRIEVQVPKCDAQMMRRLARGLRGTAATANGLRATLNFATTPPARGSALDIYASDLPDEYFEGVFDRKRTTSKPIDL